MGRANRMVRISLWTSRSIVLILAVLIFFLPAILDWYAQYRELTQVERTAILAAYYCCVLVVAAAMWNIDRALTDVLDGRVFTRKNVLRIRRVAWCSGGVSLICVPAACAYYPLVFMVIVMAFLCLMVGVLSSIMDAAVTIREENDLTV